MKRLDKLARKTERLRLETYSLFKDLEHLLFEFEELRKTPEISERYFKAFRKRPVYKLRKKNSLEAKVVPSREPQS